MELTLERKRLRKPNLKSRNQPDVYGNRTRSVQKSREARRQSRGSAEAGAEAGAGAGGDDQQALLQLPPRVQSGTAAAVVRRAAATLAWAAGDGSVLSTAETLIARMHPRDASGAAHALAHAHAHGAGGGGARARIGMSALQGSFHIPTLPPSALLRPPPTSTEMLVQALRRQQQRERLADPRNMRRFLDAVIHEYVDGPAPQGQAAPPPPPPSRARRPPKQLQLTGADSRHDKESGSKASSRGAAAAATAAAHAAHAAGLLVSRPPGPPPCPSYETLVRRVEKPLMPSRLLRAVPSAVAARVRPTPATAPAGPGVKPSLAHRRRSRTRGATPATATATPAATAPPPPPLPSRKALAAV